MGSPRSAGEARKPATNICVRLKAPPWWRVTLLAIMAMVTPTAGLVRATPPHGQFWRWGEASNPGPGPRPHLSFDDPEGVCLDDEPHLDYEVQGIGSLDTPPVAGEDGPPTEEGVGMEVEAQPFHKAKNFTGQWQGIR